MDSSTRQRLKAMIHADPLNIIGKEAKRKSAFTHPMGWRFLEYDSKSNSYEVMSVFWKCGSLVHPELGSYKCSPQDILSEIDLATIREPLVQDYNIIDQLEEIGLHEVTTERQHKNGTRIFYDDEANCWWASYKSGYARRIYRPSGQSPTWSGRPGSISMYYLNKKSKTMSYPAAIFIDDEDRRLKLIYDRVHKYREYLEKGKDGRAYT